MAVVIPNIIHCSHHLERKKKLLKELATQGIESYNIWEGVYGKKSMVANINAAHKQIIQWAKDNGETKVLIFEDDIKFCDEGAFQYYLDNEPDDYDIYLGGIYLGQIKDRIVKQFTALHCYMVHERFYDTFLNAPDDRHIDHALTGAGKYVVCDPMIAVQYDGWSDNSQKYCNYQIILESKNLYRKSLNLTQ